MPQLILELLSHFLLTHTFETYARMQWAYRCEARLGTHPSTAATAHASAPPTPRVQHFPLLRAAADLLMMPKDLLLDEAVRKDVSAVLTPRYARGPLAVKGT